MSYRGTHPANIAGILREKGLEDLATEVEAMGRAAGVRFMEDGLPKSQKLYVRATELSCDSYTSYWSVQRHEWGPLADASVFTAEEIKTIHSAGKVGGAMVDVDTGNGFSKVWVPSGVQYRWDEMPLPVKARDALECAEELEARVREEEAEDAAA